jgi:hypothetical protein
MQSFALPARLLAFAIVCGAILLAMVFPVIASEKAMAQSSDSGNASQQPVYANPILSLNAKCCDGFGTDYTATLLQDTTIDWSYIWASSLECGTFNVISHNPPHAFWSHPTPDQCTTDTHSGTVTLSAYHLSRVPNSHGNYYGHGHYNVDIYRCTDSAGSPSNVVPGDSCTFERMLDYQPTVSEFLGQNLTSYLEHPPKLIITNGNQPSSAGQLSPSSPASTSSTVYGMVSMWFPFSASIPQETGTVEWQTDQQFAISPITGESYPTTSVTGFSFNATTHSMLFNITGTSSKQGFINILVPGQLLTGPFNATYDGNPIPITTAAQGNDTIIQTTLHYSTHVLNITGTSSPALDDAVFVIPGENSTSSTTIGNPSSSGPTPTPEFPFPAIMGLMMAAVFSIVIFISRKRMSSNLKDIL